MDKTIGVCTWASRTAGGDLDEPGYVPEDTRIHVEIETPGESDDPDALKLTIEISNGPGRLEPEEKTVHVDLRPRDFPRLVAVLERVIKEAELAGILPILPKEAA